MTQNPLDYTVPLWLVLLLGGVWLAAVVVIRLRVVGNARRELEVHRDRAKAREHRVLRFPDGRVSGAQLVPPAESPHAFDARPEDLESSLSYDAAVESHEVASNLARALREELEELRTRESIGLPMTDEDVLRKRKLELWFGVR